MFFNVQCAFGLDEGAHFHISITVYILYRLIPFLLTRNSRWTAVEEFLNYY